MAAIKNLFKLAVGRAKDKLAARGVLVSLLRLTSGPSSTVRLKYFMASVILYSLPLLYLLLLRRKRRNRSNRRRGRRQEQVLAGCSTRGDSRPPTAVAVPGGLRALRETPMV